MKIKEQLFIITALLFYLLFWQYGVNHFLILLNSQTLYHSLYFFHKHAYENVIHIETLHWFSKY
jgi:hypothetical protein